MIVGTQTNVRGSSVQRMRYTISVHVAMMAGKMDRPRAGRRERDAFRSDPEGYVLAYLATRPRKFRYTSRAPEMVARVEKWLSENHGEEVAR